MKPILLVVDPQNDFIDGALPVPGAKKAMSALAEWLMARPGFYQKKLVTLDWHPSNHCSFSANGGSWPSHCLQWSVGAAIFTPLLQALNSIDGEFVTALKGENPGQEEYSVFQNPEQRARIANILAQTGARQVEICGLAGDICVKNTLNDARALFGDIKFNLLEEFAPTLAQAPDINRENQA